MKYNVDTTERLRFVPFASLKPQGLLAFLLSSQLLPVGANLKVRKLIVTEEEFMSYAVKAESMSIPSKNMNHSAKKQQMIDVMYI